VIVPSPVTSIEKSEELGDTPRVAAEFLACMDKYGISNKWNVKIGFVGVIQQDSIVGFSKPMDTVYISHDVYWITKSLS
jgi:hypothetical protein